MADTDLAGRRVCIVGCGGIASTHAENLRNAVDLCFCSRSRSSAEAFNARFNGSGVFDRLEDALAADISAVVICSPPQFHKDQVVSSLAAGKSVLVEKPMCVCEAEVDGIGRALSEDPGGFLMVAENYYYKPSLSTVKEILAGGGLGTVRRIEVKKLTRQTTQDWRSGYGALLEGGIHFVALVSDLAGRGPEDVSASFPGQQPGDPERWSVTRLTYADGCTAELRYSWQTRSLTKGTFQHSHIVCDGGRITFESNGIYVIVRAGLRSRIHFPSPGDLMGYRRMTHDFLDCLAGRSEGPYSDFERAKRDLQIVFDAYRHLPDAA